MFLSVPLPAASLKPFSRGDEGVDFNDEDGSGSTDASQLEHAGSEEGETGSLDTLSEDDEALHRLLESTP
ncbi:MAG: hypothetical protein Q9205_006491 [Flavoplaca limonia]